MGIGISVFLMAVGAVMAFGVDVDESNGFNINNVGVILMIVGAIGLVVAVAIFGGRRTTTGTTTEVIRERDVL